MKQKHIWNKGKALIWHFHPFKDELHLRKKIIRWPRWEPDSFLVEAWSEELGCWVEISHKRIKVIYEVLNPPNWF